MNLVETSAENQKIELFISQSEDLPTCVKTIDIALTGMPEFQLHPTLNLTDLSRAVANSCHCVVFLSISNKDQMQMLYPFLLTMSAKIKNKEAVVIILLKQNNPKLEELLFRAGCAEVLGYSITSKAISYKLKRYLALLTTQKTKETEARFKSDSHIPQDERQNARIILIPALGHEKSFWLFRKKEYAKKYKEHWLLEIIGPAPSAGKWVRLNSERIEQEKWKWESRQSGSEFDPSPATWVFTGSKPFYDRSINRWGFVSAHPRLDLISNGQVIDTLFFSRSETILQINDSAKRALDYLPAIQATFDQDIHLIEGEEPHQRNWHDQIDSRTLTRNNWHLSDTSEEISPKEAATREALELSDIPIGLAAMEKCGLTAFVDNHPIVLVSYIPGEFSLIIDLGLNPRLSEKVEIRVKMENMGLGHKVSKDIILKGIPTSNRTQSVSNEVTLSLDESCKSAFSEIENAVIKRQKEIFLFFSRARGA